MTSATQLLAPLFLRNPLNIPTLSTLTWAGRGSEENLKSPDQSTAGLLPSLNYSERSGLSAQICD